MNFNKKLAVAVSGAVLLMAGQIALADSTTDIVDALVGKGVLTEEEGKLITKGHESKKEKTLEGKFKDGFVIENSDGSNSMKIGGRLHMDYRNFNNSLVSTSASTLGDKQTDTFDVRRARIELSGTYRKYYDYLISTDLADAKTGLSSTTTSSNSLDQVYLNIKWIPKAQIRVGQFKQPQNLEKLTSSNNIDFQERSFVNQLAGNEDRGAMLWGEPISGITYAGGVFTGAGGKNRNDVYKRNDDVEFTGRVTANFAQLMDNKDMILHAGLSGSTTTIDVKNTADKFDGWLSSGANKARTEARGSEFLILPDLTTSTVTDIDRKRIGLEGIAAYGPFKVQAEWIRNSFEGTATAVANKVIAGSFDNNIDAYYVQALYLITGEKYADFYKGGAFGGIKPKSEFNPDTGSGYGAWEVGYRYSSIDASDFANIIHATDLGTKQTLKANAHTAQLKWVPNNNTRILLDYVRTDFDNKIDFGYGTTDKEQAVTTRVQFMF